MNQAPDEPMRWIELEPKFDGPDSAAVWAAWAHELAVTRALPARRRRAAIRSLHQEFAERIPAVIAADRARLEAATLLARDLAEQGWRMRFQDDRLHIAPPQKLGPLMEEKRRVRAQLHLQRDAQLDAAAPRRFLRKMETQRQHNGRWVSIFSLMRDGRELAAALRAAQRADTEGGGRSGLHEVVRPYLQEVREDTRCEHTGLLLRDIWRYFRHTWASPYRTTPGRNLDLIIRDAAADHHPVIGIASIISSAAQIAIRDRWIGWSSAEVLRSLREEPSAEWAAWLEQVWDRSADELFLQDFLEDGLVTPAELQALDPSLIKRLRSYSEDRRKEHARFAQGSHHKAKLPLTEDGFPDWEHRARTLLYKSKRALRLAELIRARAALDEHLYEAGPEGIAALLGTAEGRWAAGYLARRAKADKMGVAIADIGVCGSVAPYNHLLGGKLVSMLMVSPELQALYAARYGEAQSVIASSNAGRPIVRGTELVLLMTTSLYGAGSSQYNRIRVPCERVGGAGGEVIRYECLGLTEGFGTSQFSDEAIEALGRVVSQGQVGQRINSFFGEGTNPRLRKVREGLDALKLPSADLLKHGSPKAVYVIPLAANLRRFLLGLDEAPEYLLPQDDPAGGTAAISRWWSERWLSMRAEKEEILQRVERETLRAPVRHGARVRRSDLQAPGLFG
jgi:hypothetical protein